MTSTLSNILVLSSTWVAYFLLHSLLTSLAVKRWAAERIPDVMPAYRV